MEVAEIARLREAANDGMDGRDRVWALALASTLDALEQAQKERDETLGDRLEFARQVMTFDKLAEESISEIESLTAQRDQAQKQLPEGMEHCTIVFEECERGHGHLRGTNWIKNPCMVCQLDQAQNAAKDARALLRECAAFIGKRGIRSSDLCARIEAMLTQ